MAPGPPTAGVPTNEEYERFMNQVAEYHRQRGYVTLKADVVATSNLYLGRPSIANRKSVEDLCTS